MRLIDQERGAFRVPNWANLSAYARYSRRVCVVPDNYEYTPHLPAGWDIITARCFVVYCKQADIQAWCVQEMSARISSRTTFPVPHAEMMEIVMRNRPETLAMAYARYELLDRRPRFHLHLAAKAELDWLLIDDVYVPSPVEIASRMMPESG